MASNKSLHVSLRSLRSLRFISVATGPNRKERKERKDGPHACFTGRRQSLDHCVRVHLRIERAGIRRHLPEVLIEGPGVA